MYLIGYCAKLATKGVLFVKQSRGKVCDNAKASSRLTDAVNVSHLQRSVRQVGREQHESARRHDVAECSMPLAR